MFHCPAKRWPIIPQGRHGLIGARINWTPVVNQPQARKTIRNEGNTAPLIHEGCASGYEQLAFNAAQMRYNLQLSKRVYAARNMRVSKPRLYGYTQEASHVAITANVKQMRKHSTPSLVVQNQA